MYAPLCMPRPMAHCHAAPATPNAMQTHSIPTPRGTFGAHRFGPRHAPLVIALHGFPDTARSWRSVGERLAAQGFHVVAPYLRGYAPSPLEGPFDVDALADDLAAIVAAVSPGAPVVLVGHDWGAVIAYIALLRHPTLFRVAVTLAVPHPLAFLESLPRTPSQVLRSSYMALFQIPRVAEAIVTRNDFAFIDTLWQRWSPGYVLPPDARRSVWPTAQAVEEIVANFRGRLALRLHQFHIQYQIFQHQLGGYRQQHRLPVFFAELRGLFGDFANMAAYQQAQIVFVAGQITVVDRVFDFDFADQVGEAGAGDIHERRKIFWQTGSGRQHDDALAA